MTDKQTVNSASHLRKPFQSDNQRNPVPTERDHLMALIMDEVISSRSVGQAKDVAEWVLAINENAYKAGYERAVNDCLAIVDKERNS